MPQQERINSPGTVEKIPEIKEINLETMRNGRQIMIKQTQTLRNRDSSQKILQSLYCSWLFLVIESTLKFYKILIFLLGAHNFWIIGFWIGSIKNDKSDNCQVWIPAPLSLGQMWRQTDLWANQLARKHFWRHINHQLSFLSVFNWANPKTWFSAI